MAHKEQHSRDSKKKPKKDDKNKKAPFQHEQHHDRIDTSFERNENS